MPALLCLFALAVGPWQTSPGDNVAKVENDVLRIDQSADRDTARYASASCSLAFQNGGPWQVDLLFKYGAVRNAGVSLTLRRSGRETVWLGADAFYGAMTLFAGKEQLWHKKADSAWHSLVAWSDGATTRVYLDGAQVGTAAGSAAPDALTVESRAPKAGRQTELSVANVHAYNAPQPSFRIFGE